MISGFKTLFLAAAMLPTLASADALNYKYAEGGLDILNAGQDFMGVQARGAFSITDNVFAIAGVRSLSDITAYSHVWFGAGYNQAINQQTSAWVGGSLDVQQVEYRYRYRFTNRTYTEDVKETAPAVRGGVRYQLTPQLELAGSARFVTGDFDHYAFTGTTRFAVTNQFHLLGEIEVYEGDPGLLLGGSFMF